MKRNKLTLDDYILAGAYARICKDILKKTHVALSNVLLAKDADKLRVIENKLDSVISKAEDEMFSRFPDEVDDSYASVFYGAVSVDPRNDTDYEVKQIMREIADKLHTDSLVPELRYIKDNTNLRI